MKKRRKLSYIMLAAIVLVILVPCMVLLLSGCGNMSMGLGNFQFNIVHICDYGGNVIDCEIQQWYDSEFGIEILTKDGNSMFLSEGTYILAKDHCPICEE